MIVLALDTALSAASVCLWDSRAQACLAAETKIMARGHETVLMGMVERVMEKLPGGFLSVDRIAVTVGPGSFTGLRIGVAAARGLSLAAQTPVVGVSTLAAFAAAEIGKSRAATFVASVDARKGRVFAQIFEANGRAASQPFLASARECLDSLGHGSVRLIGSGASLLAIEAWRSGRTVEVADEAPVHPDIVAVARLGALADPAVARPQPLYFEAAAVTVRKSAAPATPA